MEHKTEDNHLHLKRLEDYVVIASNDPALTDLPKIGDLEEDVRQSAKEAAKAEFIGDISEDASPFDYINGYHDGYKAASKKKYTEEDMKAALILGVVLGRNTILKNFDKEFNQFLDKLKPSPKQIEIEMEVNCTIYEGKSTKCLCIQNNYKGDGCLYWRPKLNDKGEVIIKYVSYDKNKL